MVGSGLVALAAMAMARGLDVPGSSSISFERLGVPPPPPLPVVGILVAVWCRPWWRLI